MTPLLISLKVALWSTILILPPGIGLGYLLARTRFRGRSVIDTLASLPLVLPPTAVGYVLLRALGRHGPLGEATLGVDLDLLFTWKAAVLAACVMALASTCSSIASTSS